MEDLYIVDWFKECNPPPNDAGRKTFYNRDEATAFVEKKEADGCEVSWFCEEVNIGEEY